MSYFATLLCSHAHTLRLPKQCDDDIARFVRQHQEGSLGPEGAPFRRKLDLWAFSVVTAISRGMPPIQEKSARWGKKFIDTKSVEMSDEVCEMLAVIALTTLGPDHDDIDDPAAIVELGNRLAGAGCPLVIKSLRDPDLRTTPLDKVLEFATELYESSAANVSESLEVS